MDWEMGYRKVDRKVRHWVYPWETWRENEMDEMSVSKKDVWKGHGMDSTREFGRVDWKERHWDDARVVSTVVWWDVPREIGMD